MQINKIYFDMDGVLADFDRGITELCLMKPQKQGVEGATSDDELWAAVRNVENFYNKLVPIKGAVEMFNTLREQYGDKCEILSAVPKPRRNIQTAREDKIRWVKRILSDEVVINLIIIFIIIFVYTIYFLF